MSKKWQAVIWIGLWGFWVMVSRNNHPTLLPCTPSCTLGGTGAVGPPAVLGNGQVTLDYSADVWPVTISLLGPGIDSNGITNILVGQHCQATLECEDGELIAGNYHWSVSHGSPFKGYTFTNSTGTNSAASTYMPLGSERTNILDVWFATDNTAATIACQFDLAVPAGSLPAAGFSGNSIVKTFTIIKPKVTWIAGQNYGGFVQGFQPDYPVNSFSAQELWGPITTTVSPPFDNGNSQGTCCLIQIGSPTRSNTRHTTPGKLSVYQNITILLPDGSSSKSATPIGLDGAAPYSHGQIQDPNNSNKFTPVDGTPGSGQYSWQTNVKGYSGDQPSQSYASKDSDSGGNDWYAAHAADTYDTWVMYKPFGDNSVYVPLQELTWSWSGDANRTSTSPETWNVTGYPVDPGMPAKTTHFPSAPDAASVSTNEWNMMLSVPLNVGP